MPDHDPPTTTALAPLPASLGGPGRRRLVLAGAAALLTSGLVLGGVYAVEQSHAPAAVATQATQDQGAPLLGSGSPRGDLRRQGDVSSAAYAPETYGDATAKQSRGLVEITSTLGDGSARGTGIILTSDGTVVTNHHVVAGATAIEVTDVATGRTYTATYVGGDASADVAVLRLQGASDLEPARLATTPASTDDEVTAVGDAGGDGGTLTASPGTVRALDQHITVQEDDGTTASLTGLIEVHAYVVPGDSGGAVLDSDGAVVGMNVAASSGSRVVTGYAIPIAEVSSVVQQILSGQESSTIDLGYNGYLGIGLDPRSEVPRVARTTTSAGASRAGIVAGDTITSLDGTAVSTVTGLRALLARTSPGDRVKVGWTDADGAAHSAVVTLVQGPVS